MGVAYAACGKGVVKTIWGKIGEKKLKKISYYDIELLHFLLLCLNRWGFGLSGFSLGEIVKRVIL